MWCDEAQRSDHFALRGLRYVLQFRNNQDLDVDECHAELIAISAKAKRGWPVPSTTDARRFYGPRNKLLCAGIQRRKGRQVESRCSDCVQISTGCCSYGRATGVEQTRCCRVRVNRR